MGQSVSQCPSEDSRLSGPVCVAIVEFSCSVGQSVSQCPSEDSRLSGPVCSYR